MAWLNEFPDLKTARERAETAFYAPIGMMSPLWIAFGAAASAGAAFWLMTRLAKPVNIEAEMAHPSETPTLEEAQVEPGAPSVVDETAIEAAADEAQPVADVADDLMQLAGVGPKIAAAL